MNKKTKLIVFNSLKEHIVLILSIFILVIFSSLISLINPYIYKYILDTVIPEKAVNALLISLILMVIVPWIGVFIASAKNYLSAKLGDYVTRNIRIKTFDTCIRAMTDEFERIDTAQIRNRLTRESGKIGEVYISGNLVSLFSQIILIISIFISMFTLNVKLTFICMIGLPAAFLFTKYVSKRSKAIDLDMMNELERFDRFLGQTFNMLKTIKIKNAQVFEKNKFILWLKKYRLIRLKSSVTHNINRFLMGDLIINLLYGLIFFISGIEVMNNRMTVGELVMFVAFVPKIYSSFRNILNIKISSAVIKNSFDKIDELLNLKQEVSGKTELTGKLSTVEFENVCFNYNRNDFSLNNISFCVNSGEKAAIVGSSGGGKSTIIDLILRLYEPKSGRIIINGIDIKELDIDSLRSKIAVVTQKIELFNTTIRDNILYPEINENTNLTEIFNAVSLNELINRLPEGEDTVVGDRGDMLSGGEKQRILTASALLKDADVILLDEFTSALDVETENKIIEKINSLKEKTVIMITHRIYTVSSFDKVIVLKDGEICESGNPKQLLQQNSEFKNLWDNVNVKI